MDLLRHPADPGGAVALYQLQWHEDTGLWTLVETDGVTHRSVDQRWAWAEACRQIRAARGWEQAEAAAAVGLFA